MGPESYRAKVKDVIMCLKLLVVHVHIISKLLPSLNAFF